MTDDIIKDAISLRKYLHQHPEVSSQEKNTSAYIKEKLKDCSPDEVVVFDNYGVAAVFNGSQAGKAVLIRGDFDALPIEEINDFEHRSVVSGVSHKCGHDGHTAILYALARKLSLEKSRRGTVILLFQPAEENGEGAKGVIQDEKFNVLKPDYAVALHNLPGYPLHSVVCKQGTFTAAANSIIIKLYGKTSHAAEPELGINPAEAMAKITQAFLSRNEPNLESEDFKIATPIYTTMGDKSYGVSAGYGELHFTLRAWDNDIIQAFEKECEEISQEIASQHGLRAKVEWTQSFFANQNNPRVTDAIRAASKANGLELVHRDVPFKWGEDFGIFTEKFPGAMFGIGAGEQSPALHNPDYDFPDSLIETGCNMFYELIAELQK